MILKQTPLSLRSLKGAPLSTLMTLHLANGPLPHKDIMAWTGYSDKTITRALDILDSMGLAVQDSLSWYLTQQGTILFRRLVGLGNDCANSVTTIDEEPETADPVEAPTNQENSAHSQPTKHGRFPRHHSLISKHGHFPSNQEKSRPQTTHLPPAPSSWGGYQHEQSPQPTEMGYPKLRPRPLGQNQAR